MGNHCRCTNSNTTLVKVKCLLPAVTDANGENSNTTLVKVKLIPGSTTTGK